MSTPEHDIPGIDDEIEDEQDDQHESWEAFWAEVQREKAAERGELQTEVIRGVTVTVPHDLPLRFDRETERVRNSSSLSDIKALLEDLFGLDVLEAWMDAGMMHDEFQVVLAWGVANGRGRPTTFREAYEIVTAGAEGKAKSSARKSGGSGGSGGPSKRTSTRATGSRRKR
jgi:hypothetical protein